MHSHLQQPPHLNANNHICTFINCHLIFIAMATYHIIPTSIPPYSSPPPSYDPTPPAISSPPPLPLPWPLSKHPQPTPALPPHHSSSPNTSAPLTFAPVSLWNPLHYALQKPTHHYFHQFYYLGRLCYLGDILVQQPVGQHHFLHLYPCSLGMAAGEVTMGVALVLKLVGGTACWHWIPLFCFSCFQHMMMLVLILGEKQKKSCCLLGLICWSLQCCICHLVE